MKSNVLCKRLISVLLSGAVLAGSGTTAFAAGTGSSEVTLRIDTGAVSYTHLDVYKRQI